MREKLVAWWPEATIALAVVLVGLLESPEVGLYTSHDLWVYVVVLAFATAALLSRRDPAVALGIVWVTCAFQLVSSLPLMLTQASVGVVAFGCARWGSSVVVAVSGASIPAAGLCALLGTRFDTYVHVLSSFGTPQLLHKIYDASSSYLVVAGFAGFAFLVVPWLLGLLLRSLARTEESRASQVAAEEDAEAAQRESEQLREIARLREDQARFARDVHDVVGHSLAVILAQAESAQFLEESERLKTTLATIAGSARTSLRDVRAVLMAGKEDAPQGGLDELIAGVRSSGHEVVSSEVGTPQPLAPELEVVAYRVLQEMLTNAIRHGTRDEPVFVERHWPDGSWEGELRMEVRNVVGAGEPVDPGDTVEGGQGLDGMRRRLESVGGRVDVRRREEPSGTTFTTTAWVPVRSVADRRQSP
jgi:signal transduction histidine kinase